MNLESRYLGKNLLLLIIILGFLLRSINLTTGFPTLFLYNDEAIYHQSALNVIANKTLSTLGNYGPLGSYIQIPFILIAYLTMLADGTLRSPADLELLLTTQEGYLLFIPRVISALFGVLSIIVIYKISRGLFGIRRAAVWASILFATSFNLVHVSHLARSWSPAIFFGLLSILFSIVGQGQKKSASNLKIIFSYILAAIAFGFHQIAGIIIICVILLRLFSFRKKINFFKSKVDILGFLLWASLVMTFNFLSLGTNLLSIFTPNDTHVGLIYLPKDFQSIFDFLFKLFAQNNFIKILTDLFLTDPIIFIFSVLFFFSYKINRSILPLLLFLSINFLVMSLIFPPFLRYMLLSISLLPIFAGYTISYLLKNSKTTYIFGVLLLILTCFNSLYWNFLISREPTFDMVRKWVDNNIDPRIPIIITSRRNFSWVPSSYSSQFVRKSDSGYYSRASKLLGESYPANVRNVLDSSKFEGASKTVAVNRALKIYPAIYIVDWYYGSYDRLYTSRVDKNLKLVAHFSPTPGYVSNEKLPETMFDAPYNFPLFKVDRPGPYFDVLKVEW